MIDWTGDPKSFKPLLMTLDQFTERFEQEQHAFLKLCGKEGVSFRVEKTEPIRGPAFAEKLILCMNVDQAQKLIRSDVEGAEGLIELAQNLVGSCKPPPFLYEQLPAQDLMPFYVLSSLAIDAAQRDKDFLQQHKWELGGS